MLHVPRFVAHAVVDPQIAGVCTGRRFNAVPVEAAREKSSQVMMAGAEALPTLLNDPRLTEPRTPTPVACALPSAPISTTTRAVLINQAVRQRTAITVRRGFYQPVMTSDAPLTSWASTAVVRVIENALVATVMDGAV